MSKFNKKATGIKHIPVLAFTSTGDEEMAILSKAFEQSIQLRDGLNHFFNPRSKTRDKSIEVYLEPENLIETLSLPEMTEQLVTIWEMTESPNKNHGDNFPDTYISEQLKENLGDEVQWIDFLETDPVHELIEKGWLELDFDLIEHFKSRFDGEGSHSIIYDHMVLLETFNPEPDEDDNLERLVMKLENDSPFSPGRQTKIENLKSYISQFNMAYRNLSDSLRELNTYLTSDEE